ncbi:hypothetical protein [Allochromatium palmeri]|uniref:DUF4214 domain-containing protein n=1 Tax=Allochromatium palmeri TaxID=231048 RepID=A0A6N8EK10_9GAMM|nr:hypothetical protein [Allochromatium palmeri]MTW22664.1 hypothetical protein [Allochromatium palmeri]
MPTADQYDAKVSAYFLVTLGRPASAAELAGYTQVLADNNGSVWNPAGGSLVNYLTPLLEAETAGQNNGEIVTSMFIRMTGSEPSMSLYNYYVGMLDQGTIQLKGLANAMLNDCNLMPNVDGEFSQPSTWTVDLSDELLPGQREAMIAKTGVAEAFTAALDTPAENNAFIDNPEPAIQLLAGVTDEQTALDADAQIDTVIDEIVNGPTPSDDIINIGSPELDPFAKQLSDGGVNAEDFGSDTVHLALGSMGNDVVLGMILGDPDSNPQADIVSFSNVPNGPGNNASDLASTINLIELGWNFDASDFGVAGYAYKDALDFYDMTLHFDSGESLTFIDFIQNTSATTAFNNQYDSALSLQGGNAGDTVELTNSVEIAGLISHLFVTGNLEIA